MKLPPKRHGWPPERDPFEPFPAEIPWDVPIADLSSWWLRLQIDGVTTEYPLRLLAAERGWTLTLRNVLARLRRGGRAPDSAILLARGGLEFRRSMRPEGLYHVLVGPEPEFRD